MKIRKQSKQLVYTGELACAMQERKDTLEAFGIVIRSVETREISLSAEQLSGLKSMRNCLLDLKPPAEVTSAKAK